MARSVNKVILVGNVGKDPELRQMPNSKRVCSFPLATSVSWKDKEDATGQSYKTQTEWHNVVVFSDPLINLIFPLKGASRYPIKKGSKVYIEGSLCYRKYQDKDGVQRMRTEVVLSGFAAQLIGLESKDDHGGGRGSHGSDYHGQEADDHFGGSESDTYSMLDDDIPF